MLVGFQKSHWDDIYKMGYSQEAHTEKAACGQTVCFFHIDTTPTTSHLLGEDWLCQTGGLVPHFLISLRHSRFLFNPVCQYFKSFAAALRAAKTTLGLGGLQRITDQQQKAASEARHLLSENPLIAQM